MSKKYLKDIASFIKNAIPLPGTEKPVSTTTSPQIRTTELGDDVPFSSLPPEPKSTTTNTPTVKIRTTELGDDVPFSSLPPEPKSTPAAPSSSATIAKMQDQMIALYSDLKSNKAFQGLYGYPNISPGQEKGSDYFLYFLLNRYTKKSDLQGKQAKPDVGGTEDIKGSRLLDVESPAPLDFHKLLDNLQNIGQHTAQGLHKPDGKWGEYTNNGLKTIYSLAYAIVNITKNMKIALEYTDRDLSELKNNIPDDFKDIKDANAQSAAITNNIAKLRNAIKSFAAEMLDEGGKFSEYINNQKSFDAGYTKKPADFLNEKDKTHLSTLIQPSPTTQLIANVPGVNTPQDISNVSGNSIPLNFDNISDINKFKKYLEDNKIVIGTEPAWKNNDSVIKVLDTLIKSVSSKTQPKVGT
jgi:hypothetical protein